MSKFKLTQTATEVQDILNNSLQKPTGLTKTKLVGVGANGQENIEIGDNLTLANGKLSSAAAGGGKLYCHHIEFNYSSSTGGYIVIDYYNKDQKRFTTIKQFASAFNRKRLICSGYVKVNNERYTPLHVSDQLEDLYVSYSDSSYVLKQISINNWNFDDSVYEVN